MFNVLTLVYNYINKYYNKYQPLKLFSFNMLHTCKEMNENSYINNIPLYSNTYISYTLYTYP